MSSFSSLFGLLGPPRTTRTFLSPRREHDQESSHRHQWFWPHWPQRSARNLRIRTHRHRCRRHQRPGSGGNQCPSDALRFSPWQVPARGCRRRRHHQGWRRELQGSRRARSLQASLEGTRHRHRGAGCGVAGGFPRHRDLVLAAGRPVGSPRPGRTGGVDCPRRPTRHLPGEPSRGVTGKTGRARGDRSGQPLRRRTTTALRRRRAPAAPLRGDRLGVTHGYREPCRRRAPAPTGRPLLPDTRRRPARSARAPRPGRRGGVRRPR